MKYSGTCYHGTSPEMARDILLKGFNLSIGDDLYLGDGIYFFEEDPSSAFKWCKKKRYKGCFVIEANVEANEIFDLTKSHNKRILEKAIDYIRMGLRSEKSSEIFLLDGAAINYIYKYIKKFDLVRCQFSLHNVYSQKQWSRIRDIVMYVCVRHLECITSFKKYKGA